MNDSDLEISLTAVSVSISLAGRGCADTSLDCIGLTPGPAVSSGKECTFCFAAVSNCALDRQGLVQGLAADSACGLDMLTLGWDEFQSSSDFWKKALENESIERNLLAR